MNINMRHLTSNSSRGHLRASDAGAPARQARTTRRTRSCCRRRRRGCCRACAACWPRPRPRRCWAPPPRARASRFTPGAAARPDTPETARARPCAVAGAAAARARARVPHWLAARARGQRVAPCGPLQDAMRAGNGACRQPPPSRERQHAQSARPAALAVTGRGDRRARRDAAAVSRPSARQVMVFTRAQLAALEAEAAARRTRRRVVGVGSQLCLVDVPRVSRARAERARPRPPPAGNMRSPQAPPSPPARRRRAAGRDGCIGVQDALCSLPVQAPARSSQTREHRGAPSARRGAGGQRRPAGRMAHPGRGVLRGHTLLLQAGRVHVPVLAPVLPVHDRDRRPAAVAAGARPGALRGPAVLRTGRSLPGVGACVCSCAGPQPAPIGGALAMPL